MIIPVFRNNDSATESLQAPRRGLAFAIVLGFMVTLAIGTYFLDTPNPRPPCNWQQASALELSEVNIKPDQDSFSRFAYIANCQLKYQVSGRTYEKWDNCGVRGTKEQVKLQLARANPACTLWYDPLRPSRAISYCLER